MYTADMELNHLKTFIVVAEEKNVTKAAERLFMTPPSVSAHIKALEDEMNIQLFVRKPQGMEITEHGEILRLKAEKILNSTREMVNLSKKLQSSLMGVNRIGLSATSRSQHAATLIGQMQEVHPDVELTFVSSSTYKIVQALKNHSLDGGYIFGPIEDDTLLGYSLGNAHLVVAVPPAWKDQIANAAWKDIASLPWVASTAYCPFQTVIEKIFKKRKLVLQNIIRTDDEATKCDLVQVGVGLSLLEKSEAEQAQAEGKLLIWESEPISCKISWVHLKNRKDDPLISALTAEVLKIWNVS
jgi:DNA-binding transcriptional LysR family regulator